jgi:WD40 repeat protein/serine/threonine protein kinase
MTNDRSASDVLDELAESFLAQCRRGEHPAVEEVARAHPDLAERIRELFPALLAMEALNPAPAPVSPVMPARLGEYRLLRELGRGGMGIVYEAVQEPLGRRVALKVLPLGALIRPERLERFRREARNAARLHHTNIVPVFGVGECDGLNFFAMQYIRGPSLEAVLADLRRRRDQPTDPTAVEERNSTDAVATAALTGGSRTEYYRGVARLGVQAAEALAYAHAHGVLHRDVKPSNLLLDVDGTLWLTDFGLARAADDDPLTESGDLIGTLRYLAPETLRRSADPRSDVYSLGLTLYELLTLRPAFTATERRRLLDEVLHHEPPPPRSLDRGIPRDLETIVLKAAERDPERRYVDAAALAADLRRFLAEQPVQARRVGPLGRAWRWCRRNPVIAGLTFAMAAVLLIGSAVSTFFAIQSARRGQRAEDNAAEAARHAAEARRNAAESQRHAVEARTRAAEAVAEKEQVRHNLYLVRLQLALTAWRDGDVAHCRRLLDETAPRSGEPDLRQFEWHHLNWLCRSDLATFAQSGPCLGVAASADGQLVAAAGGDGVTVWDLRTRRVLRELGKGNGPYLRLAFSSDGRFLAAGTGNNELSGRFHPLIQTAELRQRGLIKGDDELERRGLPTTAVRVWDVSTGREVVSAVSFVDEVWSVAFSPDGSRLAAGDFSGAVKLLPLDGGPVLTLAGPGGAVCDLHFAPDGQRLFGVAEDGDVRVWDASGKVVEGRDSPRKTLRPCVLSPNAQRLAVVLTGAVPPIVEVRDRSGTAEPRQLRGHSTEVQCLVFAPDGGRMATGSLDQTIRLWDPLYGREVGVLKGHTAFVRSLAFSGDGQYLVSGADDGTVKVWDARRGQGPVVLTGHTAIVASVAYSPDGRWLATGQVGGEVQVRDARTLRPVRTLRGPGGDVRCLTFSGDGRRLAATGRPLAGHGVTVWDVADGGTVRTVRLTGSSEICAVALDHDGHRLAINCLDGTVLLHDTASGREVLRLSGGGGYGIAFHPDDLRLAIGGVDGSVTLCDASGEDVRRLQIHGPAKRITGLVFSPDGRRLASAGWDGLVKVCDAEGTVLLVLDGHKKDQRQVTCLAYGPDGQRLFSRDSRGAVTVWDTTTGLETLTLSGMQSTYRSYGTMAVSPDGRRVAVCAFGLGENGPAGRRFRAEIWDTTLPSGSE